MSDLIGRLATRRVAVVGDVMLDHFLIGHVDRISPEAPVPVVCFERDEYRLGGAANVAQNVATLGGQASVVGLMGDDDAARELCRQLQIAGLDAGGLVQDATRPTTRKMRIVTNRNQQVARVDRERDAEATGRVLDELIDRIRHAAATTDALVLSDYRKGVVVPAVIAAAVAAAATRGIPVLVDPKVAHAERYRGASLITPNHHEAELMARTVIRTIDDARRAARLLREQTGANVLITWGEHGMWMLDGSGATVVEQALPAMAREVADVTGAGDTVIAVLGLALAAGAALADAAHLANIAAGLVVARFGPASVTPEELSAATLAGA
ncbi:MAG: D-glycero-beta-D-manno-heptose-7-phosphate kinase [Acidobacteria bacterium]|nr:D-glycero-beta-D-manno-heptose-7-phosphate kinase [Acidobacteriota bacterium]